MDAGIGTPTKEGRVDMKRYNPKAEFPEDCDRIIKLADEHGWDLSTADAVTVWEFYSGWLCAGWMGLPESDEELWWILEACLQGEYPREKDHPGGTIILTP